MESELQLKDIIGIIKRRYLFFVVPFVLFLSAAVSVAVLLPPLYESSGLILIESPQISQNIVAGSVDSAARERIAIIERRVMTRANLLAIAEKYNVFTAEEKKSRTSSDIVAEVRDLSGVEFITTGASRFRQTTIAFRVSFSHRRPQIAVRVANELVTLFMNENVRTRTQIATETTEFLNQEAEKLERQLIEIEDKIATYKQEHSEALPENLELQIKVRERLERQIFDLGREVKGYEEELRFLDVQLRGAQAEASAAATPKIIRQQAQQAPQIDTTPINEYNVLREALAEARATKADKHPDVRALERKLESERARINSRGGQAAMLMRIVDLQDQLKSIDSSDEEDASGRQELEQELKGLQTELVKVEPTAPEIQDVDPTLRTLSQLNIENVRTKTAVVQERIESLRSQKSTLDERLNEIERSIILTPQVDRALRGLERDYDNAQRKYNEIRDKAMEAQIAENVEEASKSERFVLVEPPTVSDHPVKPNRPQLLAIGIAASFAAGAAALFGIEFIDGGIRGPENLAALIDMVPLAVIPYIETTQEQRSRRTQGYWVLAIFIVGGVAALIALHFLYMPLDRVLYKVMDRFS